MWSWVVIQASDSIRPGYSGLGEELKQMGEDLSLTPCISLTLLWAGENGSYLAVLSVVMTVITIAASEQFAGHVQFLPVLI